MADLWKSVTSRLSRLFGRRRRSAGPPPTAAPPRASAARPHRATPPGPPSGRHLEYSPQVDGQPDPGEIVWTWVAYEDEPGHGKDRPVLVVGRRGDLLLGLMLSSRGERSGQRHWFALGAGAWDSEARPSWVRLDRVLEVGEDSIRREGAVLDRKRFDTIAAVLRATYGWS